MNTNELYELHDRNDESIYFLDKACTMPYTGHIEEYFKGQLSMESDVVEGYRDGICKEYYDDTHTIELIGGIKYNMANGFHIEFYESGRIRSISLVVNNCFFDSYDYDEEGKLTLVEIWPNDKRLPFGPDFDQSIISKLRQKYNLAEINEEILRDGQDFSYEKYFRE